MPNSNLETMRGQARSVLRQVVPWLRQSALTSKTNHKGTRGRIGIVGGARDYAGAPYFASISAMRLGADLAYVICSRDAGQVIKNYSPDLIVMPLLDCPNEAEFDSEMDCLMERLHALVVGPGLGREKLLQRRAKELIQKAKSKHMSLIIDADCLMLVNEDLSLIKSYPRALLTPNRIELQRMLDKVYAPKTFDLRDTKAEDVQDLVERCSRDLDVTILAKGMTDIICDGSMKSALLTDCTSGSDRRCGGQGDITCGLAGVFTHWIEQANKSSKANLENPMAWAGYLAAITTRRCNELAYQERGNGALATDMIDKIPTALKELSERNEASKTSVFQYSGLLSNDEINRYTRQMIMEEFGPSRQVTLRKASALIIGAGGLGCPAAVYLGAGGIGCLGVVDDDVVEASNLHRQILHNMNKIGMLKTESIKEAVLAINPNVKVNTHSVKMNRHNAVNLIEQYDIIIDCTDNLLTRCLFPEPPPPSAVGSCSDNGVLGVLPGIIGVNQALEAMKIGAGLRPAYAGKMLLFDGQMGLYRLVTISSRRPDCKACGPSSNLGRNLIDYDEFCGQTCTDQATSNNILKPVDRITVEQYKDILLSKKPHVIVDVRPKEQSDISRFKHALQLPVMVMLRDREGTIREIKKELDDRNTSEIYVVCRKGIASQRGTNIIRDYLRDEMPEVVVKDIIGGMTTWAKQADPDGYSCL